MVVFQFHSVQTYTAQKAANYLSKELEVPITVKRLEIDFWNKVILKDLYVEDQINDTLLQLKELDISISELDFSEKKLDVFIHLIDPHVETSKSKGDSLYNHQFLIDYFTSSDTVKDNSKWKFTLDGVQVTNGSYSLDNYNKEKQSFGVDYFHIKADSISLLAMDVDFKSDTVELEIKELSLKEQSGFELQQLAAQARLYSGVVDLKELIIEVNKTLVKGRYSMRADNFSDYTDYNNKVTMKAELESSIVNFSDLVYFVPPLKGIKNQIFIDGKIEGTVANLVGNDVQFKIDNQTYLAGDFKFRGLPNFENTFINAHLKELKTTATALRNIPIPPFNEGKTLEVPNSFNQLGTVLFKGNYSGYPSDFVAFGVFQSALGNLKTDISLKKNKQKEYTYKGTVGSTAFNIGQLLEQQELNEIALDVSIEGKGFSKEDANFKTKGKINHLDFKDYRYRGIEIDGGFKQEDFTGNIKINDSNLSAIFKGEINLNKKTPISKFDLKVVSAKLAVLNLFNITDSLTSVSFQSQIDLKGSDIDNVSGSAYITDLSYKDKKLNHTIDEFSLNASKNLEVRKLELLSSFIDAKMEGEFKVKNLPQLAENYWHLFISDSNFNAHALPHQDFTLNAKFKNSFPITEVLLPELLIDSGLSINSRFSSWDSIFKFTATGPRFEYLNNSLEEFNMQINSIHDSLVLAFNAQLLSIEEIEDIKGVSINSTLDESTSINKIDINSFGDKISNIDLTIDNTISSLEEMTFEFINSSFIVNDSLWKVENNNEILLDSSTLEISSFSIGHLNQKLSLSGKASKQIADSLFLDLNEIDLQFVSSLLPENSINLEGVANGSTTITSIFNTPSVTTDLALDSLIANSVDIGQCQVSSIWDPESNSLVIDGNLGDNESEILKVKGSVFPLEKENSLDLTLNFSEFPLELIRPYLVDYISDLEGVLNGEVGVKGAAEQPKLQGVLGLNNTKMHVNYLNTSYTIDDQIVIEPDFIGFNFIKIIDENESPAIATGTIFHENYSNFNYDIGLEFTNFLSLNTTSKDNDLFYGKGIASGSANISGYSNQLILELDLKTEKGTDFKIPLEEGVDVSNADFLVFTNSPDYNKEKEPEVDLSGIDLNFDLEITPDAKLQIIFDEQVGDIIKAQGQGDLSMIINSIGDFNMFGQFLVEKGDYLFTLQNVINKKFEIAPKSSIYWDGDPYQAVLNMTAIYKLRAPLYDLFPNDSTDEFKRRTPIELGLKLNDNLMNPSIGFDIQLPDATEENKRKLESVLYVNSNEVNPQEMNQQVFGLLVLNRFLPSANSTTTSGYSAGAQGLNNGYEFVSNQLSNWASQLSDQFDFGFKYQPADELNTNQLDVSVSSQFFQDKLIVDGNFGYSSDNPDLQNQNSGFVGEFTAIYKLGQEDRFRLKGFNRSVANSLIQLNSPYTQGIGLFYRKEFNSFDELWKKDLNK